ncbi:hypothetical protein [Sorangium sp. So ce1389]|uniref:hypothetical protein n=1 Tax=Sorangium sp. So ce1389 TaxID=3133336 RepID=UPI003F63F7B2
MSWGEGERSSFLDRLTATLELTAGGKTFSVTAGDLKRFELDIAPWGFEGSASFSFVAVAAQGEDELFARFIEKDLVEVSLEVARTFDEVEEAAAPMTLKGVVTDRSVVERAFPDVAGSPVLQRRYAIRFEDRGGALFRQHRPTALYVDRSLKELIEDNTPAGVAFAYAWTAGEKKRPVLSLGLGVDGGDASFRDFLFWLLHRENAGLYYDAAEDSYRVASTKPDGGAAKPLRRSVVASIEARFPPVRRDAVSVLNASTEAATKTKTISNEQGAQGVRTDHLIRSSIAARLDDRVTLETARAKQREPEAVVCFREFPTKPLLPSMKVEIEGAFGANVYQHDRTYRVVSTRIRAEAERQEATDDNGEESNVYRIEHELCLELASDPVFRFPDFRRPVWPFHVEGKVLSEAGEETQGTYQTYQEEGTSLDVYKVKVPLWDDQKVIVPFEPSYQSGHFYFPASRDQRVLLELHFDRARIAAFLDWRPGARLPADAQGNHLLVGKGDKNETSIRHVYTDAKPTLTITRSMDKDQQVITISEGTIRLETMETKDGG